MATVHDSFDWALLIGSVFVAPVASIFAAIYGGKIAADAAMRAQEQATRAERQLAEESRRTELRARQHRIGVELGRVLERLDEHSNLVHKLGANSIERAEPHALEVKSSCEIYERIAVEANLLVPIVLVAQCDTLIFSARTVTSSFLKDAADAEARAQRELAGASVAGRSPSNIEADLKRAVAQAGDRYRDGLEALRGDTVSCRAAVDRWLREIPTG